MTRQEWKLHAAHLLAGTDAPARTAQMLLCHVLGITRETLAAHGEEPLCPGDERTLGELLERRLRGEPVAYLVGTREFYGRDFLVDRSTLIPRPETEDMVDFALAFFKDRGTLRFLDLGTGSGCIAVTLAAERAGWSGTAVDISPEALRTAKENAVACGVAGRLDFLEADMAEKLPLAADLHLVISNPPYVTPGEYAGLDAGVRDFEPFSALVPGPSGMEAAMAVVSRAQELLLPGGLLLMEHGMDQGEGCRALCGPGYWQDVRTGRDLAGRDRFLSAVHR